MTEDTYEKIYWAFHDALSRLTTDELKEMVLDPYLEFRVK